MPARPSNPLLNLLACVANSALVHIIELQRAQLEMYKARDPRLRLTKAERRLILQLAEPLGTKVREVLFVCAYATLLRWRRGQSKTLRDGVGRPTLPQELRQLVISLAEQNPGWGYTRILGELLKLGFSRKDISRSSIKNLLDAEGLVPAPKRRRGNWSEFIKRHAQTLWACDFISRKVFTPFGMKDCFILFFIHLESRRVHLAGVTTCPHRDWLTQQARNVCMQFNDLREKPSYLIHDRDGKFAPMGSVFKSEGIEPVLTPAKSPNCNAVAERWVRSFSDECLNHFVFFGEDHLRHVAEVYVDFYNRKRPHQSKNNRPLAATGETIVPTTSAIRCQEFLGGLLRHYYRKAA